MTDLLTPLNLFLLGLILSLALLIRVYLPRFFSRFDAAYATCAYFIKYNKDLHGIIGPIVETKELPIPSDNADLRYRRYDIAVTGQHMSGILKCTLTADAIGWNTKWQMSSARFLPDSGGEEIALKV